MVKKESEVYSKIDTLIELMQQRESATADLIKRVDRVFSLFEEASKHVSEVQSAEARITALSEKLEALLEQNKAIAQGLILLEKYVRGKTRLEPVIGVSKPTSEFGSP